MAKLWFGGKIYTMREENEFVEAVITDKGKIVDMGSFELMKKKYEQSIDEEIDLMGKVMYPGFVDSHLHIIGHGERLLHLDLSYLSSPEQLKEALEMHAKNLEPGEWLIGEGWNENQWDNPRIITRQELDEICPDHPMMLTRVCRHALLANTKAIEIAGVTDKTLDPQGGVIVRDEQGRATGYFLDTAQDLIKDAMPDVSQAFLEKAIHVATDDLIANGLVGGHSEDLHYYGGFKKTFNAFCNSIDGENKKFRANLLVHHGAMQEMDEEKMGFKQGTSFVQLGAMKIFSDGAIGGRTAWLSKPYHDDEGNYGVAIHTQEGLESLVKNARNHDMPVAVHAIGDKAVEAVIDVIEKYPAPNGTRDRIIHAQILREELLPRLQKLEVIIDIQPTFVSSDFPWVIDRIGEQRLNYAYAWKLLIDNGIICAGGSDAPIEEINPLLGIQAAVARVSSFDSEVYGEGQCLSIYEAVSLYTKGSALAISEENNRGIIELGYLADFTVLDRDLFTIEPKDINQIKVEMTVIDETIAYTRNDY